MAASSTLSVPSLTFLDYFDDTYRTTSFARVIRVYIDESQNGANNVQSPTSSQNATNSSPSSSPSPVLGKKSVDTPTSVAKNGTSSSDLKQGEGEAKEGTPVIVVLDRTIFYPQGGGQPSDVGRIRIIGGRKREWEKCAKSHDGKVEVTRAAGGYDGREGDDRGNGGSGKGSDDVVDVDITFVALDKTDGIVRHRGMIKNMSTEDLGRLEGAPCELTVDEKTRRLHSRLHSAGHLIDYVLTDLGHTDWVASKGYHFPSGPDNTYIVPDNFDFKTFDKTKLAEQITAKCGDYYREGLTVEKTYNPSDDRTFKVERLVKYGKQGCLCGGTHVNDAKEIGEVFIRKIETNKKKCTVRICYNLVSL